MVSLLFALLLASTASAQYTTSFWQPRFPYFPERLGYLGSIQAVDSSSATTVDLDWDKGVDDSGLGFGTYEGGITIGPQTWVFTKAVEACSKPDPDKNTITCSHIYPPEAVSRIACSTNKDYVDTETQTHLNTYTNSYPARLSYTSGVETVTQTIIWYPDTTPIPEWCNDPNFTPETSTTYWTLSETDVWTIQLAITAGLEKLNIEATPTPTGSANPTVSQTSTQPQETNAAGRIMPGMNVVMGMGAAIAAIVL